VNRRDYVCAGLLLMLVKYGVETLMIYSVTGQAYSPIAFLSPFATHGHVQFSTLLIVTKFL
jgi:hypothetical protein